MPRASAPYMETSVKTKDYDSTLARIAGNIASGMMHDFYERSREGYEEGVDRVANVSVEVAEKIVAICKEKHVDPNHA